MPKTKFQEFIYGVLMTFFMVLAMELYNTGLRTGGLTNAALPLALHEMTFMFPICFVMGFFFIDRSGAEVIISHCENLEGAMALKRQILADLPVNRVELLSCRGLTSFYAMEKGLIVGY